MRGRCLTHHSSRHRFAARLDPGVGPRPCIATVVDFPENDRHGQVPDLLSRRSDGRVRWRVGGSEPRRTHRDRGDDGGGGPPLWRWHRETVPSMLVSAVGMAAESGCPWTPPLNGGFSVLAPCSRGEAVALAARIAKACHCGRELLVFGFAPQSGISTEMVRKWRSTAHSIRGRFAARLCSAPFSRAGLSP